MELVCFENTKVVRVLTGFGFRRYVDRTDVRAVFTELCSDVSAWWKAREKRLQGLADEARGRVWWPFTQHASTPNVLVIDSAQGDNFTVAVNGGRGER